MCKMHVCIFLICEVKDIRNNSAVQQDIATQTRSGRWRIEQLQLYQQTTLAFILIKVIGGLSE